MQTPSGFPETRALHRAEFARNAQLARLPTLHTQASKPLVGDPAKIPLPERAPPQVNGAVPSKGLVALKTPPRHGFGREPVDGVSKKRDTSDAKHLKVRGHRGVKGKVKAQHAEFPAERDHEEVTGRRIAYGEQSGTGNAAQDEAVARVEYPSRIAANVEEGEGGVG